MNAKVLKTFRDKDTKSILRPDQIIDITEERFEELSSSSLGIFVEKIEEPTNGPKEEKAPDEELQKEIKKKSTKK